jgi:hypothetical protein
MENTPFGRYGIAFSKEFTLIKIDLPGHGKSENYKL